MGIEERFCKICGLGFLDDHPEHPHLFWKCRTCGYTIEVNQEKQKEILKKQDTREHKDYK